MPDGLPPDPNSVADGMVELYPHGATEIGLFGRCGAALPEVLRGRTDSLTLLFSSGYPTPADLYLKRRSRLPPTGFSEMRSGCSWPNCHLAGVSG